MDLRSPKWIPLLGRFVPVGVVEALLALYVLGAWIDIDLYGPGTPYDVRFLVVAEGGILLFGGFVSLLLQTRPVLVCVLLLAHLALWSQVLGPGILAAASPLGLLVVTIHSVSIAVHLLRAPSAKDRFLQDSYVLPLLAMGVAASVASFVPLPQLDWTYYGVPAAIRVHLDSLPFGAGNWFPAVGFIYFAGLVGLRCAVHASRRSGAA